MLRWSPSDFWSATVWDITDAFNGYTKSKGAAKDSAISESKALELVEQLKETKRKEAVKQHVSTYHRRANDSHQSG